MNDPECACKHCGQPTSYTGTKLCNRCWELERRLTVDPQLTRKIASANGYVFMDKEMAEEIRQELHKLRSHELGKKIAALMK